MTYTEDQLVDLATKNYHSGVARFSYQAATSALIVVDMQDEFVRPGWCSSWIPEATRQVGRIRQLIEFCRRRGVPVLYTVFSRTHQYLDRPRSGSALPNRFPELGDDPGWFRDGAVWHELQPLPHEIVLHKCSYGAFYDTPLETILRNLGVETIVVCGTLTNCCCGATAREGYERGFQVVVGEDVTSTYTPEMQQAELCALRFAFARVQSADDIMRSL